MSNKEKIDWYEIVEKLSREKIRFLEIANLLNLTDDFELNFMLFYSALKEFSAAQLSDYQKYD